jgi:hypothetical protein
MRSGRLATASSACHNGRGGETAKPGKQAPGEKMAVCGVCTETCSLPRMPAFDTAACWTMAWQRRCLDGPIGVHRTAVVRAQEGAIRETTATNRRHCVAVLGSTNAVGLCRTATSDGVRRAPRQPRRSPAPAGGQNEPADQWDDCFHLFIGGKWASGGRFAGGGAEAAGRTSTGATCAISTSKRGSSGAQASPL